MKLSSSGILRNFFLWLKSKEFLIFLFFLIVAGLFWLMLALKDVVEYEVPIPVNIVHIPSNVTINYDGNDSLDVAKGKEYDILGYDTLHVTIRDNAYNILGYLFNKSSVNVNYIKGEEDKISVSASDLLKKLKLDKSAEVVASKPERLEIYYSYGDYKYKPVALYGNVTAADKYFLIGPKVMPESVRVTGTPARLAKIDSVRTHYFRITDVSEKLERKVMLQKPQGVMLGVKEVSVVVSADMLSETTREVQIETINVPENKVLRTIPGRVSVKFNIAAQLEKNISSDDFKVVADYNELHSEKSTIPLHLIQKPVNVRTAVLETKEVGYKIEHR